MGDAFSIDDLRFFERNDDFTVVWKHLPHWTQAATITFITWRQFWQTDQFDHLVRSEEQLRFLRDYIRKNPERAGLKPGSFMHYSREM